MWISYFSFSSRFDFLASRQCLKFCSEQKSFEFHKFEKQNREIHRCPPTWISLSCPRGMCRDAAVTHLSFKSSLVVIRGQWDTQKITFSLQNVLWLRSLILGCSTSRISTSKLHFQPLPYSFSKEQIKYLWKKYWANKKCVCGKILGDRCNENLHFTFSREECRVQYHLKLTLF